MIQGVNSPEELSTKQRRLVQDPTRYPESAVPLELCVPMNVDGDAAGENVDGGRVHRLYGLHCASTLGSTLSIGGCCK